MLSEAAEAFVKGTIKGYLEGNNDQPTLDALDVEAVDKIDKAYDEYVGGLCPDHDFFGPFIAAEWQRVRSETLTTLTTVAVAD